jgi:hypothetical protein
VGSGEDDRRLWLMLGEMKAGIDSANKELAELRTESKSSSNTLHQRITDLATNGCARGAEQDRRIDKLERDNRAIRQGRGKHVLVGTAAGGGIAATFLAIVEAIKAWKSTSP